jgi:hypothetical protein
MKPSTRASIAAIATAAAVGGTGAFLLPAASARTAINTLTFTSVQQSTVNFSRTVGAAQDKDVDKAGKVLGYDVLRFSFDPAANTASIGVAIDLKGGFLYGVMHESGGPVIRGTVTGGTGAFTGASGAITAKSLNQNDTKTAVTITYRS